ncbi:hypothetical protein BJ165DRAFT_1412160 [Panaeolus papilionaceus]|nr:hypothetical protein BJ165DRAFT_1412160 [Panaeolus papilionaceus]
MRDVDEFGNSTRTATKIRLDMVRHAILEEQKILPNDKHIWYPLRNKDISKKIRAFVWTGMHDAHKIGEYWSNKTNYEHRGRCRLCDTTETMDHILTECRGSGQEIAWKLAKAVLRKRDLNWKTPSLGQMLGQGYENPGRKISKKRRGLQRLKRIVITETMHLIWKLRYPDKLHGKEKLLKIDCLLTNRKKYGNKALSRGLVKDTWAGTLENEINLVEDWTKPGVLVGIATVSISPCGFRLPYLHG